MVYHPRMKPLTRGWEWIDGCTIFISIWIILSIWFGYAGLLSPVVGVVSLILAYGVAQKIPPSVREPPLRTATVAFAIMFVGLAAILFGVQGGFDLSADATPSVATMIIAQGIPATYSPFFDLPVFYQMGLPAVASQFVPLGFPPHIVLWFFAIMGIGIFLAGLLRLGARINPNPLFLFWVPIVFFGNAISGVQCPFGRIPVAHFFWIRNGCSVFVLSIVESWTPCFNSVWTRAPVRWFTICTCLGRVHSANASKIVSNSGRRNRLDSSPCRVPHSSLFARSARVTLERRTIFGRKYFCKRVVGGTRSRCPRRGVGNSKDNLA